MNDQTTLRRVVDGCLSLTVAVSGIAEIWVPFSSAMGDGSPAVSSGTVVLLAALLLFRRRWPLAVSVAILWTWPLVYVATPILVLFWGQFVPMAIAVFSVARFGRGREPLLGAAAAAVTLLFFDLNVEVLQTPGEFVFHWMVFITAWSFGWGLRTMEQRARTSTRRAIEVEVAAAEQAMAAVVEERSRIARELHDIIAHSVSVMVVQAGAAEQAVDEPEVTRQALRTIRTTGTGALAEMRRAVAMLRDDEEVGALTPQPGVEGLPSLVEEARSAGLEASLVVEGTSRPLPAGLDLAAYRIAQEALTNVRRHAHASTAEIVLRYGERQMELEVADDGIGVNGGPSTGGHGLIGMRERVALYGGELETGSRDGGGFRVHARLPLEPA